MSSDSQTDNLSPLSREEWDFEAVPDEELVACCLWEYARESETIHRHAEQFWCAMHEARAGRGVDPMESMTPGEKKRYQFYKDRLASSALDSETFRDRLYETDYPWIGIYDQVLRYAAAEALTWFKLPPSFRQELVASVHESSILKASSLSIVGDLEALWKANRGELDKARASDPQNHGDNEMFAMYESSVPWVQDDEEQKLQSARMTAAFTFDFSRFTDAEILKDIEVWLASHRPEAWTKPLRVFPSSPAKGKKTLEFRVALERLGLMRLLHWYSPSDLRRVWPEAWKRYGSKEDSFRREIRASVAYFHKLFPFLPENERMQSEKRLGVWLAEWDDLPLDTEGA
ncbi:MAG: hypothetical protein ABL974_06355 [Prosthecobacter sp.]